MRPGKMVEGATSPIWLSSMIVQLLLAVVIAFVGRVDGAPAPAAEAAPDTPALSDDTFPMRYVANRAQRLNLGDGRICDWSGYAFHPVGSSTDSSVSFQYDDDFLYVAVVVDRDGTSRAEQRVHDNGWLWLIIGDRRDAAADDYAPGDSVLLIRAPTDSENYESIWGTLDHSAESLNAGIFSSPAVNMREHIRQADQPVRHHAARSDGGFTVEVAIPRHGSEEMLLQVVWEHGDDVHPLTIDHAFAVVAFS